jgi:DNA-binding transcriptional regulator LsrR (DeoR family)
LITLGINPDAGLVLERNPELETSLRITFGLQNAIVIPFPQEIRYRAEHDYRLQAMLGRVLADHLKIITRSGDHIGVSGGRPNYEAAKALYQQGPLPLEKVRVTSLTGRLSFSHRQQEAQAFDADDVTFMLAAAFENGTPQPLSMNRVYQSPDLVVQLRQESPGALISERHWAEDPDQYRPDIALLGVSSLDGRGEHAFRQLDAIATAPIQDLAKSLLALVDELPYSPVGDFGGQLFFVSPPTGDPIPPEAEKEIRELIAEINARTLSVTWDQLRQINKVIIAAGGLLEVEALYTLLNDPGLIHELCTDEMTAMMLVERKKK